MAIDPLTHVQLFTDRTVWSGSVSSPRGLLLVGISDSAQGNHELAFEELHAHLNDQWGLDPDLIWVQTGPGVWTAELK